MSLEDIQDDEVQSAMNSDGTWNKAQGGTELMNKALYERVDNDLLDQFNIIKSRVREVSTDQPNILWLHDLWADPEAQHLREPESRERFAQLIFVSNWQLQSYNMGLGVPYRGSIVLKNAIDPIPLIEKPKDQIRLIYHTTPHRGLQLLIPIMEELAKIHGDSIHLDIYSSFEAYGWKERDEPYLDLFERAKAHPQMTYHGFQPNDVVRKALQEAHIFAFPSIWQETSCIAAIEAMSAGCEIVCPNLAALPETTAGFSTGYQYSEDMNHHANIFANVLHQAILGHRDESQQKKLIFQKNYIDNFYNWDLRAAEWTGVLQALVPEKKKIKFSTGG
jgi:glycosyltransferase involved in cell wall biosynthesis